MQGSAALAVSCEQRNRVCRQEHKPHGAREAELGVESPKGLWVPEAAVPESKAFLQFVGRLQQIPLSA